MQRFTQIISTEDGNHEQEPEQKQEAQWVGEEAQQFHFLESIPSLNQHEQQRHRTTRVPEFELLQKRLKISKKERSSLGLTLVSGSLRFMVENYNHVKDILDPDSNDTSENSDFLVMRALKMTLTQLLNVTICQTTKKIIRIRQKLINRCAATSAVPNFLSPKDQSESSSDSKYVSSEYRGHTKNSTSS